MSQFNRLSQFTKAPKTPQRTSTQQDLAAVRGGTGGLIIVENILQTHDHGPMR